MLALGFQESDLVAGKKAKTKKILLEMVHSHFQKEVKGAEKKIADSVGITSSIAQAFKCTEQKKPSEKYNNYLYLEINCIFDKNDLEGVFGKLEGVFELIFTALSPHTFERLDFLSKFTVFKKLSFFS